MDRIVLIDGNALMHRAYHAIPPLTTSNGELINAVYGFTSMLLKIFQDLRPEYAACAFDLKAPTFRNLEFTGYKAKRPKMDEKLVSQIDRIHEVVATLNIPIFEIEGFEADDVIATLATQAEEEKIEAVIVTGDRDALQLIDANIKVYCPLKGLSNPILYDENRVLEKYGLKPNQIADFKALAGDASDNYPGIAGIGPKTATDLLQRFGTLDKIYEHIGEISNEKIKTKLVENVDFAYKCQKLARAARDVPLTLTLSKCRLKDYDLAKVSKLFAELEFRSLIKKLPGQERTSEPKEKKHENKTKLTKTDVEQLKLF